MRIDLTGMRFGRLVVIKDSLQRDKKRNRLWQCQCDCGAIDLATTELLNKGQKQSCGCLQRELASKSRIVDHIGRRFGMLTVLSMHSTGQGYGAAYAHWLCRCDCGREKVVMSGKLVSGETVSCGCAKNGQTPLRSADVRAASVAKFHRRKARQAGAGGSFTPQQIDELYSKQRGLCANCKISLGNKYHRDHRVAIALGGSNDIHNIELLCESCNCRKHAKDAVRWAQENGRLI